jgi:hypothetical protein
LGWPFHPANAGKKSRQAATGLVSRRDSTMDSIWPSRGNFEVRAAPSLGRPPMNLFTAFVLIIVVSGCTTMRPIDGSPTELRRFISAGELLKPGDYVRIVTADEKAHRFAITKVEAGLIVGPNESVPVEQVISLEVEKAKSPASFPFDLRDAVPWAIAIAAYALKPITVDATP